MNTGTLGFGIAALNPLKMLKGVRKDLDEFTQGSLMYIVANAVHVLAKDI